MINLSIEELKTVAKLRKVKDYKYKSIDELTKKLSEPEPKIEEHFFNYRNGTDWKKIFLNQKNIMIMIILNIKE